jgi:hypothetical protein
MLVLLGAQRWVNDQPEAPAGLLAYVDDRGRARLPNPVSGRAATQLDLLDVIPVLRAPLQDGPVWATPLDVLGRQRRCTLAGPDDQRNGHVRIEFSVTDPYGVADLLGRFASGRFWLDEGTGAMSRAEAVEEDRLSGQRIEVVAILRQRERRPAAWTARRAEEARRYLLALRTEDRLWNEATQRPTDIDQVVERLVRLWAGAAPNFDARADSPIASLARGRQDRLRADGATLRGDAEYARRWLDRAAVPWSLQAPPGETVTSEELRDRPVIECLWSARTPGCLATLAAMRAIQEKIGERPVRVVCLNLDADVPLARRLIQLLPPDLTHVLAGPLEPVERPACLPVVRVLDKRGFIRRVWVGWRPEYPEALAEALRWCE